MPASDTRQSNREAVATRVRRINAVLAAALVVFFLVHACMGSLSQILPLQNSMPWITWIFAGLVLVHVGACALTSYYMMTDTIRPPSKAKVRHLILKWVSGGILLLLALMHVFATADMRIPLTVMLLGVIAWHSYVGVKSLIRDLQLPRSLKLPIRVAIIVIAIAIAAIALWGIF